jgi:hypothetical protein
VSDNEPLSPERLHEIADAVDQHGGKTAAAKALGISRDAVNRAMKKLGDVGRVSSPDRAKLPLPEPGKIARYIFTCAQSNTRLNTPVWENLLALASHYGASIHVSRFTYKKEAYGKKAVKPGKAATPEDKADLWYDPRIEGNISDDPLEVAPGLVWCGDMNILPTAARPLSGLEAFTGRKSGIFPHVKIALESIPSGKFEPTKFNYTTGTVTLRNYVAKKVGKKAEFHHGYGGLLVEVDSDGNWWARQLNADGSGTIYDLELRAKDGKVTPGHSVEAINWGDIHVGTVPQAVYRAAWVGDTSMIRVLRPRFQFFNDIVDFRSRNWHDMRNPHKMFERFVEGNDSVVKELRAVVEFLKDTEVQGCKSVVVDSNHDNSLERWLREADYRQDPRNAIFFLSAQLRKYQAIEAREDSFHLVEWAVNALDAEVGKKTRFLRPDESFVICHDANGGIECGMHGHLGPNGARGSAGGFSRMGRKANIGHTHAATIHDGTYVAGVMGSLDQGYNVGPSNWSHSSIITYKNGKRAIVTCWGGRWRA